MEDIKYPLLHMILAGGVAALGAIMMRDRYTSKVVILPDENQESAVSGLAAMEGPLSTLLAGAPSRNAMFVEILHSRYVAEILLRDVYTFQIRTWRFGDQHQVTQTLLDYLEARNLDRGVGKLPHIFSANRDTDTGVLTLTVETFSPQLSQQIAAKATRLLEDYVKNKNQTRGGNKAHFVKGRLRDVEQEYDGREQVFREFLRANHNYLASPDPDIRLRGDRLSYDMMNKREVLTTLSVSLEKALMDEKDDMPILNVLDEANTPLEKSDPHRSAIVLFAAMVAGMASWIFRHRELLARKWFRTSLATVKEG